MLLGRLVPKLIVNSGSMFSGKSTTLIAQGQRYALAGFKTLFIKPDVDTRWSIDEINTHNHLGVPAKRVDATRSILKDIPKDVDVVLIDEVQFFNTALLKDVQDLLDFGMVVIVSGLDMDYNAKPFKITKELMAVADVVTKHKAVCNRCGDDAWVSHKKTQSDTKIELGGKELYEPLCRNCFSVKEARKNKE